MSKTAFIPSVPASSEDDFDITAMSKMAGYRRFYGVLKVVRTTDGRVLFPFDGAPELGPYATKLEADRGGAGVRRTHRDERPRASGNVSAGGV